MCRRRTSFMLPQTMIDDLDYLSSCMGVSRSIMLSNVAAAPLKDLRIMFEGLPENPTPSELVRFRGESKKIVNERLEQLNKLGEDSKHDN